MLNGCMLDKGKSMFYTLAPAMFIITGSAEVIHAFQAHRIAGISICISRCRPSRTKTLQMFGWLTNRSVHDWTYWRSIYLFLSQCGSMFLTRGTASNRNEPGEFRQKSIYQAGNCRLCQCQMPKRHYRLPSSEPNWQHHSICQNRM